MKRGILLVIVLAIAGFFAYKFLFKKDSADESKPVPMVINGSDELTLSTAGALQAYFDVKDAFVKSDSSLVNQTTSVFVGKMDEVKMSKAEADTTLLELASQLKQNIKTQAADIMTGGNISDKRRAFQIMSDNLYDFLRTIRYTGSQVYQQFCPMAFDNTGAAWLSNSTEIFNPYFGDKMLKCGDVRDSLMVQ